MKYKIFIIFSIITSIFFSCDYFQTVDPEVTAPDLNESISIELPDTASQSMQSDKYDYYLSEYNQISDTQLSEYNLLKDQWDRNLISTSEFIAGTDILNQNFDDAMAELEEQRLNSAWWEPTEIEITIDNQADYKFEDVYLIFRITYETGLTDNLSVFLPYIYPESRTDESIILDTEYLIDTYAFVRAEY